MLQNISFYSMPLFIPFYPSQRYDPYPRCTGLPEL